MKTLLQTIVVLIFAVVLGGSAQAQSPNMITGWLFLGESSNQIDVSYCIVECTAGSPEICLEVFNENPTAESATFTVTATQGTNSFTHTVTNQPLTIGDMIRAECGSTAHSNLRVAIPSGYDPASLELSISFN